jgi:hypothetical protein
MKKFVALLLIVLLAVPVYAANSFTWGANKSSLTITGIDTDWNWYDAFPSKRDIGIKIFAIRFNPGAASDRCVINDGSISGSDLFDSSVAADTGDGTIEYYPTDRTFKPVLDASDGTYNAAAKITFIFME